MKWNVEDLQWTRQPESYKISQDQIEERTIISVMTMLRYFK